ncbi:glycoside hydrolase family 140 protein [Sediminibacterium soli]|uniref:glycoside hydrolase family 140 protein n=1 Tax=Sediminibacterium soli TaxID=2698829 RepID=UPI0013795515|nr:glycoside hydrolase family 140 protein [Sediminibacterium soli]NCI48180.1 DUF4038 domain-containing protein [Sediminibacterium soli]
MKILATILLFACSVSAQRPAALPLLRVSADKHFFETGKGAPFFWLGDTGWLLFTKCSREEAVQYLETRRQQGFNVIQVMVLHQLRAKNAYGDSALVNGDIAAPRAVPGSDFTKKAQYDYWDHIAYIIDEAAARGIYLALVPVWGGNIKEGHVTTQQAETYARFLATRFGNKNNIIWLNGGDIKGTDGYDVWNTIGSTIRKYDARHLIGFHPRGRYSSSEWFQQQPWLDFNMAQSGHRTYAQDTSSQEKNHFGEDNWRYIRRDYALQPTRPVLDGEPSYENIPHGLHDSLQPRWTAADLRRYAYWSVLSGGAGFTYGENAVMQFHRKGDTDGNYGVTTTWKESVAAPGAWQMQYLKKLLLGRSYFDRKPAQELLVDNSENRYRYLVAAKGNSYALVYTYTGRSFRLNMQQLGFTARKAAWYRPAGGSMTAIPVFAKKGITEFDPPGKEADGNDWVLVLEK